MFCENQDNEGAINFTPTSGSLIVLNATMQNQIIFKDIQSFNRFKTHCNKLKSIEEKNSTRQP